MESFGGGGYQDQDQMMMMMIVVKMVMMTMMVKMVMMMFMIMMITRSRSRENLYTRERGERAGEPLGGALGGFSTGEPPLGGATVARIALS